MDQATIKKPELKYRYEFAIYEPDAMSRTLDAHGFAIVKNVLPDDLVEEMKLAVWEGTDPDRTLEHGESRTRHAWVESGRRPLKLLDHEPFMRIHRHLLETDDLTIHRSAAIIRMPGSTPVSWHTDWCGFSDAPPKKAGDVLNRGLWPSGKWFYITGSRPIHGGLCVIEDSHSENWSGPDGFHLTSDRRSFYPDGEEERPYQGFDIPGMIPLFTEPGDMIIFAHRTYHGAFPNRLDEVRLSCAIGFRDRSHRIDVPWEIPDGGKRFLDSLPSHLEHYVDGYTSINTHWRG